MVLAQTPPTKTETNNLWNNAIEYYNFCNAPDDESQNTAETRTDARKRYEDMLYKSLDTSEKRVYFAELKLGKDNQTLETQIYYRVMPEKWVSKGHSLSTLERFTALYARTVEIPMPSMSANTSDKDSADPVCVTVKKDQPKRREAMRRIALRRKAANKEPKNWGDLEAIALAEKMFRDFGELLDKTDVTPKERWLTRHFTSDY